MVDRPLYKNAYWSVHSARDADIRSPSRIYLQMNNSWFRLQLDPFIYRRKVDHAADSCRTVLAVCEVTLTTAFFL
jgi:hypothetical protein